MKLILYILLICIGLFIKVKKVRWYECLTLLFIVFIVVNGKNVSDFENYKVAYDYISTGVTYNDLGMGWFYLCKIGTILGLTYMEFKVLIVVISFLLISNSIKYFLNDNKYKKLTWAFYLIFPLLLDCIQVRFLFAEVLVIYALRFLMNNKKMGVIVYIIFCLMASLIHSSTAFYLIFAIYKFLGKHESRYIIITFLFSFIFVFAKDQIVKISSMFINENRINRYFYSNDTLGIKGFLIYGTIIILFYYIAKVMLREARKNKINDKDIAFYEFNLKINIIMTVLIALSVFDPNFFRLQRIAWIFLYIGIAKLLNNDIKNINELKLSTKLIGLIIAVFGNLTLISVTTPEVINEFLL